MAFLLMSFTGQTTYKKILIILSILGVTAIFRYHQGIIDERAALASYVDVIHEERMQLSNIIELSVENSVWENTIAHYGEVTCMYLALPAGWGGNYMIGGGANMDAKYALITRGDANELSYRQMLTDTGHEVIYEDQYFIVLLNVNFAE